MTPELNVLIPMAGQGKRFRQAGYETYKPFLPIFGKPMIQYVLDAFPEHVTKRVLADLTLLTDDQLAYLEGQPDVVVHSVPSHGLGPAWTIHQARADLPLDEAFFIAYCDIFWTWSFQDVARHLERDGIVFTRRAFHPHLVGNNYSAFCSTTSDDPDRLREIREKGSFTDDWMSEPLSIGCFYVRSGHAMMDAIGRMIEEDRRVSNEFFPSLLFNDLVEDDGHVRLVDVDFFVHWGVPSQLEDLRDWVHTARRLDGHPATTPMVNACCMGGAGERMRELGDIPKAMLPVADGEPMFKYVARRFGSRESFFIVNRDLNHIGSIEGLSQDHVIDIGAPTRSQVETLNAARSFLAAQEGFLLTSCDAFGLWDDKAFRRMLDAEDPDAVVFTFQPTLLQEMLEGSHTYVEVEGGRVRAVHIKHKPNDLARGLAGFFWFRNGEVFDELDQIPEDPGRELSADHVVKFMLERGQTVAAFALDSYVHLGSPAELREFSFWRRYHQVFPMVSNGLQPSDDP